MTPWHGRAVVLGEAATMGSKRAFQHRTTGRVVVIDDKPASLRSWQREMKAAMSETRPPEPLAQAVGAVLLVYVRRPLSHYGTGVNAHRLKPSAPAFPATGRDIDKVQRAALDCGTQAGWWRDDKAVAAVWALRLFADGDGERTVIEACVLGWRYLEMVEGFARRLGVGAPDETAAGLQPRLEVG